MESVRPVGGKVEELWRKHLWKRWVFSLEWKREGVRDMDGDGGDEGCDELTCMRSDESDKSS